MLSHRIRERKYARATPVTCTCSAGIVGPDKTARKGERIEAGSVRIDSIGRPIRGSLPEEIDGREFVLVARPENNRNDRCIARVSWYRSPTDAVRRGRHLIGFGMPFTSGDPLPAASIYSGRGIALDPCIGKKQIQSRANR